MNKILTIVIILLCNGLFLAGQDIVVTTEAPSVVSAGEQFRVTWTVNSRTGDLIPPEFKDFYKLMGPQTSFSQSTQIINGKVTSSIKNSFTYYLQATKEGKFTLGSAKFIEKNREYLSREVNIEVIAAGSQAATGNTSQSGSTGDNPQQQGSVSSSDLYVRLLVNRSKVTIGEHIVATLKIYSRVNLSGLQEVNFPDFNGFLKTDLETAPLRTLERENINGEIYNSGVLQRFLIYPQKTGILEIDPSSLTVLLQERARSNDPFFGDFFSSFNTIPKVIATLPVSIEVMPLPGGAPASFHGSVGSLSLSSSMSSDTLNVNEALTFSIKLSGNGNLKLSPAPEFILSPDIELYDPKIVSDLKSTVNGTAGSKTFEYVLIPRHHGQFEIPSIDYSYFDPEINRYKTLSTTRRTFFVRKGADSDGETQVFGAVSRDNVTYLGRDIRYIHTGQVKLRKPGTHIISRSSFLIFYLSFVLLFIIILVWRREHMKRNADMIRVKNRRAAKVAKTRLKRAYSYLSVENDEEFFSELLGALWGYLSDKLGIPVSGLNLTASLKILQGKGVDDNSVILLKEIIETCEFSRYSPKGEERSTRELYENAARVIKSIENEV